MLTVIRRKWMMALTAIHNAAFDINNLAISTTLTPPLLQRPGRIPPANDADSVGLINQRWTFDPRMIDTSYFNFSPPATTAWWYLMNPLPRDVDQFDSDHGNYANQLQGPIFSYLCLRWHPPIFLNGSKLSIHSVYWYSTGCYIQIVVSRGSKCCWVFFTDKWFYDPDYMS